MSSPPRSPAAAPAVPRTRVEAEITSIISKPWGRRVIRWELTGDQPTDLRLTWRIDPAARQELEEEIFGKHVLITDHHDWPAAEVIVGYRSQSEAESGFRQMKDPHVVSFSPMHHWTDHNIRVHVFTCVLAHQLAHLMRYRARQSGLDLSVRELLRQLAGIGEAVLIYPSTGGTTQRPPHDHLAHQPPAQALPDLRPGAVGTPEFSASAAWDQVQMNSRYFGSMITAILGAPGSGKSTIAPALARLLPGHVVLDWDAFMEPAAALAGREIPENPETWPAYRDLVHAVISSVARLPVVLLGVCTPDELKDWPIDAWALLDCTDQERQRRLGQNADPQRLAEGIRDGREYRQLGLPVIDTTGRAPATVASELAVLIQSLHQSQES